MVPRSALARVPGALRRARHAARAAWRLPPRQQATLGHALLVLLVVELAIRCLPLPRLAALLGTPLDLSSREARDDLAPPALDERSWRQVDCSRRLLRLWPWGTGPCLRESLVIGHLLRRWSPVLRLGVAGRQGQLYAHAWLEVDGSPLYGAEGFEAFADLRTGRP